MKLSTTKPVWVWPTERHHSTGTAPFGLWSSTATFGTAYGSSAAPSTDVTSMPSLTSADANGVPSTMDWPTIVCFQATGAPPASSPAAIVECHIGR